MNAPYDIPTYERLGLVNPELARRVHAAEDALAANGLFFRVAQGIRTFEEQAADYAKVPKITNAKPGYSWHQFGMAVDCYPFAAGNRWDLVWDAQDPRFTRMVGALKAQGLAWGGDWKSLKDYPHFQLANIPVTPTDADRLLYSQDGMQALWDKYKVVD